MPLENNMKTPVSFGGATGVLNKSMFIIIVIYVGLGLLGFLEYGDLTEGSITLNLPDTEMYKTIAEAKQNGVDFCLLCSPVWRRRCS